MRALVTGGAGFIGSHLVEALLADGHSVAVLDDLSTGSGENLERGVDLHVADVTDAAATAAVFAAAVPEVVFHLAGRINVRHALEDPSGDARVNVVGTVVALEAARRSGARRFVLASTGGAIYGEADEVPTPETAPLAPLSPYGVGKLAAESYVAHYRRTYGLSGMALRLANVYGPRQDRRAESGVVAIFCGEREVRVFGDGLQTRDFVYAGDVAEAFVAAAHAGTDATVNVGTGRQTTLLELAAMLGRRPLLEPARLGEVRRSALDATRARELLGWQARTSLADGLARTAERLAA